MNSLFLTTNNRSSRLHRLVLAGTMAALAATTVYADDKIVENFDFQPGQTLTIDFTDGGSIRIEGSDQPGIEVEYEDEDYGLDRYDINFVSTVDGLSVTTSMLDGFNSSGINFSFRVPHELMVDVETAGGGIMIEDVVGDFSGHTGGGNLLIRNVAGDVNLETGGGRILVENSEVDGLVETGGGRVLVQNVTGDFNATSGGGEVTFRNFTSASGNPVSPTNSNLEDATSGTVSISNAGGGVKVESAPEGADVYTGGGSIRVHNASNFVAAKTGGGDIDLELTEGWVDASTGGGDIDINVAQSSSGKGDIEVFTGNGDVTLVVPANFSMSLSVELGVTNNTNKSYSVRSDFDIDTENVTDWDYTQGTPRKFTRVTANVNGGDHQVRIRNTNGNVNIKKAR